MNTQNVATLQVLQMIPRKSKSLFISLAQKSFSGFSANALQEMFKGNLQGVKIHDVIKIQIEVGMLCWKKDNLEAKKDRLASGKCLHFFKIFTPPAFNHL